MNAPPAPFVPPQHHFAPGYALLLVGFGAAEHARIVEQIRQQLPPLFDLVTPMPYVELQKLLDEASAWGSHTYEKGTYLEDLSDDVIDAITGYVPRKSSPMSMLLMYRLDGAFSWSATMRRRSAADDRRASACSSWASRPMRPG